MFLSQRDGLLSCRGVLSGGAFGTAFFSTLSSNLAINTDVRAPLSQPQPQVLPLWTPGKPLPKGAWVESFLPSMHEVRFWDLLLQVIQDLRPSPAPHALLSQFPMHLTT